MPENRIAVFGSSVNPPGNHHIEIVSVLSRMFDRFILVPCGMRPDKNSSGNIDSLHRRAMCEIAFGGIDGVDVDFFDVESESFTRTVDLISRYEGEGAVWIVIGADIVLGGGMCESEIHRIWKDGARLWEEANFSVICRPGYLLDEKDFPPNSEVVQLKLEGSSSEIREMIGNGVTDGVSVAPLVMKYIVKNKLYLRIG